MRRTPEFGKVDYTSFPSLAHLDFTRPAGVVGDFLENRRVLRALHDKLHFPELEGIVDDDDEALDAFYLFNGTRFIKGRVLSLFDSSEYSFRSMLVFLYDRFFDEIDSDLSRAFSGNSFGERSAYNFLVERESSYEFVYLSRLSEIIQSRVGVNDSYYQLIVYGADPVFYDSFGDVYTIIKRCEEVFDNWFYFVESKNFSKSRFTFFSKYFNQKKFLKRSEKFRGIITQLFQPGNHRAVLLNYIIELSACLNLPDDKYAQPGEKIFIDGWLELFDAFYPQYEKLKAWYVREKESGKLV